MTTATIRERLVLDHFYIPVAPEDLDALSPITALFRDCPRRRTVSGNEHWDGIYIPSRTGAYFEIVHYARPGGFGLGFSAARPQYCDVRKIAAELPRLPWKRGRRLWKKRRPWFDWLSLGGYSSTPPPILDAWIMHYHFSHHEDIIPPTDPRTVDRFKSIHLTMGRQNIPEVRRLISWFPGTQAWLKNEVRLALPDREGSTFLVYIDILAGTSPIKFKRVEMDLTRGERVQGGRFGAFSLTPGAHGALILGKE